MRTRFLTLLAFVTFGYAAQAQTTETAAAATQVVKPTLSKEEKAAQKAAQEKELMEALKGAGLDDAKIKSVQDAMMVANKANAALKENTTFTDADKAEAKKKITEEKNAKLKEIMGEEAYKKYNAIRKEQKAKAEAAGN